jgi:peptide chain release factor 2
MFLCTLWSVSTAEYASEVTDLLHGLETDLARFEVERLLGGKYDKYSCMMCIQSGAGGTEAQDWAGTYLIPFMGWCDRCFIHGMVRPLFH